VIDPVLGPSSGGSFGGPETLDAIRRSFAGLPQVILTPNIIEAGALLGRPVTRDTMPDAAREMLAWGARAVLITGGHLEGDPADVLATGADLRWFSQERIDAEMRGTGCTLAMALALELATGATLVDAVIAARAYVREKIATSRG